MGTAIGTAIALVLMAPSPGSSLPGEAVDEVANWIYSNPLLPDGRRGSLRVSRSDVPGQRFTFVASKTLPTQRGLGVGERRIRSEWLEVLDYNNGVTSERLIEAVRGVYGLDLYQDYRNAELIYDYVSPTGPGGQDKRRGQLWQGDRFGYWLELTERDGEEPVLGKLALILLDDIPTVQTDLEALAPPPAPSVENDPEPGEEEEDTYYQSPMGDDD
ncbi:hypothetical protein [Sodalinema gerasimenkoae]|uniref:hypothetical protein n=1 Tax=Sodalinema gerasimenkoae TaxID=2862348 RepID=UPI00135C3F91|nr:hypothetical protein [Sodalinema gerasimenkoae]